MGESGGRAHRRTHQLHDRYRRRNDIFVIALLVSLAVHAATILLAPGFRHPAFKMAQTMNVLLMPPAPAPVPQQPAPPAPPEAIAPPPEPPKPKIEPAKPAPPQPKAEIKPETSPPVRSPQLALKAAPIPESKPIPAPQPEPRPRPKSKPKPAPTPKPEPKPKPETRPKPKPKPEPAPRHPLPEAAQKTPRRHHAVESPVRRHAAPPVPASPPSTAVAPQPATPQPAPSPPINDLLDRYGKTLARIVADGQRYPRIAQMRGWQGTVEIRVTVAPPGTADGITVQRSSGHQVLDDEALDMVKRALPLPQPPGPLRDRRFTVVVPIVFRLR